MRFSTNGLENGIGVPEKHSANSLRNGIEVHRNFSDELSGFKGQMDV